MKYTVLAIFLCLSLQAGTVWAYDAEANVVSSEQATGTLDTATLSAEELKWYKTFQEGTFLIDGWHDISAELLASTPEKYRDHQRKRLELLGEKIGLEWCKDNDVRRVDTKMLQEWGKTLKNIAKKRPEQLPEIIAVIDQELDDILN